MDFAEAWSKIGSTTKTDRLTSAARNAVDVLSGWCGPVAERWDAEVDRRDKLRTPEHLKALMTAQREYNSARVTARSAAAQRRIAKQAHRGNPLAGPRRSAKVADKAARQSRRQAESVLMAARQQHPKRLVRRAVELHAAHVAPAAGSSVALSLLDPADWTVWPVALSALVIAANIAMIRLGRRSAAPAEVDAEATQEERELLERLDPTWWVAHAAERGLDGTVTGAPVLGNAGIECAVRLDGKWDVEKLRAAERQVRALLRARTNLRVEIRDGDRGGWAVIALRTRMAADGADMMWSPDRPGIGLDTVTGEPVEIPLDNRLTVAGASGSGKSWSSRPHMARAHLKGDLVFVDGKGEEATVWEKACRVAVEPDEIRQAVADVHAEMNRRKADMKRRGISVWDGPQLTLFTDEGRVILALKDKKLLQQLIDISALGRSRGVVLWWATQYPVTSGDAPGIHAQIAANTDSRFALRVKNLTHATVALDDDADYGPHLIAATKEMRGHGYLGGYGPNLIRTWTMTDDMVKSLPVKRWTPAGKQQEETAAPAERPALRLVKDDDAPTAEVPAPRPAEGADAAVLAALRTLRPPVRQKDIVTASGLPKGTVSKAVKRLVENGVLEREADGTVTVAAGEVSA